MDLVPPKDKWNLIYLTLVLHGLGTLTAWNMFITAKEYFEDYKLKGTDYQANYLTYVGWAAQIPNLVFSWVLIFVLTISLAMVDTSLYPGLFFWATMVSVFFMNGFNAIFQNSVFGIAARLPAKYTGAVVLGSNICGTLVVLLSLTSKLFASLRTSAIYYFIGGMFVLLICFDTYFALPL
ncbi:Equilibrative nucleoside transporter, partial [Operophtera brumata]